MAATTINKIEQGTSTQLLSAASLGDGSLSSASAAQNNVFATANFNGYPLASLQLTLGTYTGTPLTGAALLGWFLKSIDGGVTYEDSSSARPPDAIFPIGAVLNGPQKITLRNIDLPVGYFKTIVKSSGVGLTLGTISVDALPNSVQGQ